MPFGFGEAKTEFGTTKAPHPKHSHKTQTPEQGKL
jgi:hypothetical protein